MAETKVSGYPIMPASSWWQIRKQFAARAPRSAVTGNYLSGFLPMSPQSAAKNLLRPLRTIGLVNEDDKITERAYRWRDDAQYPAVCEEIIEEVYPEELLDIFPRQPIDRAALDNWFANSARVGISTAKQMANLYVLLLDADPKLQEDATSSAKSTKTPKSSGITQRKDQSAKVGEPTKTDKPPPATEDGHQGKSSGDLTPSLHIDVQVHISPEASPEQIDAIFASMSKHLYKNDGA